MATTRTMGQLRAELAEVRKAAQSRLEVVQRKERELNGYEETMDDGTVIVHLGSRGLLKQKLEEAAALEAKMASLTEKKAQYGTWASEGALVLYGRIDHEGNETAFDASTDKPL